MEVKDWASFAISSLALVVAVGAAIFSFHQLQTLRSQLQVDAYSRVAAVTRELVTLGFEYPELLSIFDDEPLKDLRKQERYLQLWLNHIEVMWTIHKEGLFDEAAWHASQKDIRDFFSIRLVQKHWNEVREFYPAPFIEFIWSIIPRENSEAADDL